MKEFIKVIFPFVELGFPEKNTAESRSIHL